MCERCAERRAKLLQFLILWMAQKLDRQTIRELNLEIQHDLPFDLIQEFNDQSRNVHAAINAEEKKREPDA